MRKLSDAVNCGEGGWVDALSGNEEVAIGVSVKYRFESDTDEIMSLL
jgi:hypothetical protein